MLVGYAVVAEWIEEDGSRSMNVIHSAMPPWHLYGLLTYGRDSYAPSDGGDGVLVDMGEWEGWEEGDDEEDFPD